VFSRCQVVSLKVNETFQKRVCMFREFLMDPTNKPVGPGELLPARTNQSIGTDFFSLSLRAERGQKDSSPRSALLASTEEAAETISPYSLPEPNPMVCESSRAPSTTEPNPPHPPDADSHALSIESHL
jgi:hypothetical protein